MFSDVYARIKVLCISFDFTCHRIGQMKGNCCLPLKVNVKKNKEETKEGIPIFSHKWIANFMAKRKENEAKEKQQ